MEVSIQEEDRALCVRKEIYEQRYSCIKHGGVASFIAAILFQRRKNGNGIYDLVAILDESLGDGWVIEEEIEKKDWPKYREWIRNFSVEDYRKLMAEIDRFRFYDDDDASSYVDFPAKTF